MLKGLDDDHFAVSVIVELRHEMSDEELERKNLSDAQKALFPAILDSGLPATWASSNCDQLSLPECDHGGPVKQFRSWLAKLTPADRDLLLKKGIDAGHLESVLREGKVAGLMYDLTLPEGALKLIGSSDVRAAYLVGVQLRRPIP